MARIFVKWGSTCPVQGKICYKSPAAVWQAINRIASRSGRAAGHAYQCEHCKWWHMGKSPTREDLQ